MGLSASTQRTTSLRELLGEPADLDRVVLTNKLRIVDPLLWEHAQAVADFVGAVVGLMPEIPEFQRAAWLDAAWLHDIGKLTLSRDTLFKPGPLSEAEWVEMHEHPSRGAAYLAASHNLGCDRTDSPPSSRVV